MPRYIAIARSGAGMIAKGDRITFESDRQVSESSGLPFRREIAEAVRQQLHADVAQGAEAQTATNFDVYSEERYAEVREKLEAAAAREAAAEERRRKAEEREAAKAAREAEKAGAEEEKAGGRVGQNGGAIRPRKKGQKSGSSVLGALGKVKLKSLLKFLVGAVAVIWFLATQLKSCSLESVLQEMGVKTEQTTKKSSSTSKKSTSTSKKSSAAKKSSTAKKTTTAAKKTTTAKKKSSTTKKKTTAKKSTAKKKKSS